MTRSLGSHVSVKRAWVNLRYPRLDTFSYRQITSDAKNRIDFSALEAKWSSKWQDRGIEARNGWSPASPHRHALPPFYLRHLRTPSILEVIEYHYAKTMSAGRGREATRHMIDRVFKLAPTESSPLRQFVQSHGTDVVRTSLLFSGQTTSGGGISEKDIELTQQWFEMIKEAVSIAHGHYRFMQGYRNISVNPTHGFGANWRGYTSLRLMHQVQAPSVEPEMANEPFNTETYRLWLAAQKAILVYTAPITYSNTTRWIRSRLMYLSKAIIEYSKEGEFCFDTHYYAARVLISLLAPSAPSFAEECWLRLHYGDQQRNEGDPSWAVDGPEREEIIKLMLEQTEELDDNKRYRPRQGQPSTLQSIFDQPFPVARLRA
ncbi:hypothetical protein F5Y10DRAFT_246655 [Nemania abortiva]|nr:hypothetical protein F5Y10DRAFT_246655 [Nemania abortiva]